MLFFLLLIPVIYCKSCKITEFECYNHVCINNNKYCNGQRDCSSFEDEPKGCSPCNRTFSGDLEDTYILNLHKFSNCLLTFLGESRDYIVQIRATSSRPTIIQILENFQNSFITPINYYSRSNVAKLFINSSSYDLEIIYKFIRKRDPKINTGSLLPSTYCSYIYNECNSCVLESPNYPGSFPSNITCYYAIKSSLLISLRIPQKFTEDSFIAIYDGYTVSDRLLVRVEKDMELRYPVVGSASELLVELWTGSGRGKPFQIPIEYIQGNKFSCNAIISSLKYRKGKIQNPKYTLPSNTKQPCKIEFNGLGKSEILKLEIYKFLLEESDCETTYLDLKDANTTLRLCYNSTFRVCEHKLKFGQASRNCNEKESYLLNSDSLLQFSLEHPTVLTNFEFLIGYEFIKGEECVQIFETENSRFYSPRNPYNKVCNYTFLNKGRIEIQDFVGNRKIRIYEFVKGVKFFRGFFKNVRFESIDRVEILIEDSVMFTGKYFPVDNKGCIEQKVTGSGKLTLTPCNNVFLITPRSSENYLYLRIPSCSNVKVFTTEERNCESEIYSENWFNETFSQDFFVVHYTGLTQMVIDYLEISKNEVNCQYCSATSLVCIDKSLFCNGITNCPFGEDESFCSNGYLWLIIALGLCVFVLFIIVCMWRGSNDKGPDE